MSVASGISIPAVRHRSLTDTIADTLRNMILIGDLPSGSRITQDELARMLSVSTTPVREALLKLAAQGLIETSPNRSIRIIRTTREDIRDTYWQHAALAAELTRRACLNRSKDLLDELHTSQLAHTEAVEHGRIEAIESANWKLHRAINTAAQSPRLLFMLKATLRFIPHGLYTEIKGWGETSAAAHHMIVAAVSSGYADAAAQTASEHVREAGDRLIALLESRGFWDTPQP